MLSVRPHSHLRSHPYYYPRCLPRQPIHVPVHGLLIDPHTGELTCIVDGYGAQPVLTGGAPAPASEQRSSSLQGGEWLASSSESSPPPCS